MKRMNLTQGSAQQVVSYKRILTIKRNIVLALLMIPLDMSDSLDNNLPNLNKDLSLQESVSLLSRAMKSKISSNSPTKS
jgi:hypothetical protein